jgi:hypothetical protein
VKNPSLYNAADILVEEKLPMSRSIMAWLATQYFEHKSIYVTCNYLAGFSAVRWVARRVAKRAVCTAARDHVVSGARTYNKRLGGDHPFVLLVVAVCTTGAILMAVVSMFRMFSPKRSDVVIEEEQAPVVVTDVDAQVDLSSVGRKPERRAEDKKNVWTVTERAITKLDVDPRRPLTLDQNINVLRTCCMLRPEC